MHHENAEDDIAVSVPAQEASMRLYIAISGQHEGRERRFISAEVAITRQTIGYALWNRKTNKDAMKARDCINNGFYTTPCNKLEREWWGNVV
jgi:hypothetical protein